MKLEKHYPGLCEERTPSGKTRWRVRLDGQKRRKLTLPVEPGHPEFEDHYLAARAGERFSKPFAPKIGKYTLDAFCEDFTAWIKVQVEAGNLRPLTLGSRITASRQARGCPSPNGNVRMGRMTFHLAREAFAHIRDPCGVRTGAAQTCLKALRGAYTWGEDYGYPVRSPVFRVKSNHVEEGGATPWSDADAKQFPDAHGRGTMARRWFLLAELTAGRIGDMPLLEPSHERMRNEELFIRDQPTKRDSSEVELPLPWTFMLEVATLPPGAGAHLLTARGVPFASPAALGRKVRDRIIEAGLSAPVLDDAGRPVMCSRREPELRATRSQHGIRKRRAEKIAEASGSVFEVMAHLSHSDPKTAAIYTKGVDRARLAGQAARRVEGASSGRSVPPPIDRGTLPGVSSRGITKK